MPYSSTFSSTLVFSSTFSSTFNVSIFYQIIYCFLEISHLFHRSTNTGHKSSQKHFWRNFPVFQKNLHYVQNLNNNGFAGILKCYLLITWESIKISVRFHKSTHQTLPLWPKRISGKFPSFPEKLTLCAKFGQKWLSVTPWLRDNQSKFQSYSTNLHTNHYYCDQKIHGKCSNFSENLHCGQNLDKNVFAGTWSLTPYLCDDQSKFQSYSTNIHTNHYHCDQIEFLKKFAVFQEKTYSVCKIWTKMIWSLTL